MRPLHPWLKIALWAVAGGVALFVAGRFVGSCSGDESKPSQVELQADSLEATRRDFLERQRRYDSVLVAETRRADSATLEARRIRREAWARGRVADSLASLQDWHAAYLERTRERDDLLVAARKDSIAHARNEAGRNAILTSKLELTERLRVTEDETIPGLRTEIDKANKRAARQRWAGRLEGFSTGALLGAAAGAIIGSAVSK